METENSAPTDAAITGPLEGAIGDAGRSGATAAAPPAEDAEVCPICKNAWAGVDYDYCICNWVFKETKRVVGIREALERGEHVDDDVLADFEFYTLRRVGLTGLDVVEGARI